MDFMLMAVSWLFDTHDDVVRISTVVGYANPESNVNSSRGETQSALRFKTRNQPSDS